MQDDGPVRRDIQPVANFGYLGKLWIAAAIVASSGWALQCRKHPPLPLGP